MTLRNQGPLKSSCNAGELSSNLDKKLGLKQYYNGGRRFKNLEPVPQSGFRLGPGSRRIGNAASDQVRTCCLRVKEGLSYMLIFTPGQCEIYNCNTFVKVATKTNVKFTAERLPELEFYAEANTVGIFHEDIENGIRLFRNAEDETDWSMGIWPYESVPTADLGEDDYEKTSDQWMISIRFSEQTTRLAVACRVDGEETEGVDLVDNGGARIKPKNAGNGDITRLADNIELALRALPSLNDDVNVTYLKGDSTDDFWVLKVNFQGSLAGVEYDFDADVPNTAQASALVSHTQIGKTEFEPLISTERGGYGGMTLYQERAFMWAAKARKNALNASRIGEYFDLDANKIGDNAPILTAIRSDSGEQIFAVAEDTFLVIFTNEAEYFVTNRTIKQSEPLNIVEVSRYGTKKGVKPQKFDGKTWFITRDGASLYTIQYSAVSEKFEPTQQDLLASHLVDKIKRQWVQRKISGSTMPRLWELRDDGRLVYGIVVAEQEITAFVEWVAADGGLVKDIQSDGNDRLWMVTKRGDALWIEMMEEADANLFQASTTVSTNLLGVATGLTHFNGKQVWARVNGYIDGPFTVAGGSVATGIPGGHQAQIGLWQPPVYESMPYWRILPNEEILERPAQIKTLTLNIIDTESVAVGVNGLPARNLDLGTVADDLSIAPQPVTRTLELIGLNGVADGPTVVITQTRPGRLTVRDYTPGVKF